MGWCSGRCQRQIYKGFQGYAVHSQNWPPLNQRTVNKALRGPLKAYKHGSLSMVFLLEHSRWRSADQKVLADIPWCLMSPLGFHWLANERLGQRHWTDKNKVTCLASDGGKLFSFQLSHEILGSFHLIWLWAVLVIPIFSYLFTIYYTISKKNTAKNSRCDYFTQ